jgi:organic hydroperoxide reductase OsmC/OhrA
MSQQRGEQAYRVAAWWTSGRSGLVKSDSAPNAIHFTAPREFGGLEGRWTPEELLLAALTGCFTTTVRTIAGSIEFDFTDLQVEASGTIRKSQLGYGFSEIVICPTLQITHPKEREQALDVLKKAERLCLVSRAIDVPLRFEPKIEVTEAVVSV